MAVLKWKLSSYLCEQKHVLEKYGFLMSALHVCYKFYFEATEITYCFLVPFPCNFSFYAIPCTFCFLVTSTKQSSKNGNTLLLLYSNLNSTCMLPLREQEKKMQSVSETCRNKSDSSLFDWALEGWWPRTKSPKPATDRGVSLQPPPGSEVSHLGSDYENQKGPIYIKIFGARKKSALTMIRLLV